MPERQRAALLLAELHDLTGLELAEALGVSHVAARALSPAPAKASARRSPSERAARPRAACRDAGRPAMTVIGGRGGRHDDWSSEP